MSNLELPAYFTDGPRHGQSMFVGGSPQMLYFHVPQDWTCIQKLGYSDIFTRPDMKTDTYDLVRPVLLYKYRGRY